MAHTEAEEVAALDQVLTRLALTEEANLEQVLSKLLPIVISQLKSQYDKTRKKVLEILSHVNKRVRGRETIQLPLAALADLYAAPATPPLVRNFALVYLEMAVERASPGARSSVVATILAGVAGRTAQHRDMLLRMAISGLESLATLPNAAALGSEETFAARYPFLQNAADQRVFLTFALKVLQYQPPSQPKPSAVPAGLQARIQAAAMRAAAVQVGPGGAVAPPGTDEEAAALPAAPPGLCRSELPQLEGKAPPSAEQLTARKLGILNFTAAAGLPPQAVLLHYLVAAGDPTDAVSRRGEELLRKRCAIDAAKPVVDLEDKALVDSLFRLFNGTTGQEAVRPEDQVEPAGVQLRIRIINLLCKSILASNSFPATLQAVLACVYGAESSMRLKQAGMEFAVWVFKHGSDEQLAPMAGTILQGLLRLLDEGSGATDTPSLALRSFTYQAVGQLAGRAPQLFRSDPEIAARFFAALGAEPQGVRAAVQGAMGSLASAYAGAEGLALVAIENLLLERCSAAEEGPRLAAVQWATRLFPFRHLPARFICIQAAGDHKLEVREEAAAGLKPGQPTNGNANAGVAPSADYPELLRAIEYFRERIPRLGLPAESGKPLCMQPRSFLALIAFLQECRRHHRDTASDSASTTSYMGLLEHALIKDGTSELHVAALRALLEAASAAPATFAATYSHRLAWLRGFLGHVDKTAREVAAKLLGIAVEPLEPHPAAELLGELCTAFAEAEERHTRFEEQDGCLGAAGYVLAQCVTGTPAVPASVLQVTASKLCAALSMSNSALAGSAAAALGHAGLRGPLPLPEASAPVTAGTLPVAEGASGGPSTAEKPGSSESAGADAMEVAVDGAQKEAGAAGDSAGGVAKEAAKQQSEVLSRRSAINGIVTLLQDKDVKVAVRAATALGHLCYGSPVAATLEPALEGLFKLSTSKSEEVQFAVGEALCFAFGGVPVTPEVVLQSDYVSLSAHLSAQEQQQGPSSGPEAMAVDEPAGGPPAGPSEPAEQQWGKDREAAQSKIISRIMDTYIFHTRPEVRCAGCIWLLSLVSFTGRHPRLLPLLPDIQDAFSALLGDPHELTQEMASRGMSVVYALGDEAARKQLLAGLTGILQGGPRKRRAVKIAGDSQVFEEGTVGETPGGGSITTYKELCSLATELGQPDLVYRFMDLANHHASLNSSRGAAFGFASIAKLAGEQLTPFVAALVPKLYRYQYDPNPRVRDAMLHIWRALVPEPKKTVDEQYAAILAELLREMGGRLWRGREAACLALSDLLQGRRWADVKENLEDMWTMTFRALDDIKESVRAAAATLVRSLRGLTLRLCDPAATAAADAAAATAVALPFLLKTGMSSSVGEVQALALTSIAKLVSAAGPGQVQPYLPDLTTAMLESLSGMEDARLNYIEQHAERMGLDGGRLESLRVQASKSSPMADTLDLAARYADAKALESLVPRLCQLVRRGTGLNTRVGTARFISSLAGRVGTDIKPHAAALLKALVGAARMERSIAVKRAYASAAAAVAKVAATGRVEWLVSEAVALYGQAGTDREGRQLAGVLLRELSRQAPDAFAQFAAQVMPLAFIAKSDEDADVAALWGEIWEEGATSTGAALRLYMAELVPLVVEGLQSAQWGRKGASAKAIAELAEHGRDTLQPHASVLAEALLKEMPGRLWEGKEEVLRAIGALSKASPAQLDSDRVIAALVDASGRKKSTFRVAALEALAAALSTFKGQDHFATVAPPLLSAIREHATATSTSSARDNDQADDSSPQPLPLLETLVCLGAACQAAGSTTICARAPDVAQPLAAVLQPGFPWPTRVAALKTIATFIQTLVEAAEAAKASGLGKCPIECVDTFVPGILSCTEEFKVSQVRAAALDTLAVLVKSRRGDGSGFESHVRESILTRMSDLLGSEKVVAVKAQATAIQELLSLGEGVSSMVS